MKLILTIIEYRVIRALRIKGLHIASYHIISIRIVVPRSIIYILLYFTLFCSPTLHLSVLQYPVPVRRLCHDMAQYRTVQYSTLQQCTVQYGTLQHCTVQHSTYGINNTSTSQGVKLFLDGGGNSGKTLHLFCPVCGIGSLSSVCTDPLHRCSP